MITGNFTAREALELSSVFNNPTAPPPKVVVENVGADNTSGDSPDTGH